MLNVENLLKPMTIKALINIVHNYFIWEHLYTLPDWSLLNVKQVMENHICVEAASVSW
jgi:hypothetical protein